MKYWCNSRWVCEHTFQRTQRSVFDIPTSVASLQPGERVHMLWNVVLQLFHLGRKGERHQQTTYTTEDLRPTELLIAVIYKEIIHDLLKYLHSRRRFVTNNLTTNTHRYCRRKDTSFLISPSLLRHSLDEKPFQKVLLLKAAFTGMKKKKKSSFNHVLTHPLEINIICS